MDGLDCVYLTYVPRPQYGVGLFRRFWAWATPGVGSPAALAAIDSSLSPLMVRGVGCRS